MDTYAVSARRGGTTLYKLTDYMMYVCPDTNLHTVHKTTHRLLRTSVTTPGAEHHMQ